MSPKNKLRQSSIRTYYGGSGRSRSLSTPYKLSPIKISKASKISSEMKSNKHANQAQLSCVNNIHTPTANNASYPKKSCRPTSPVMTENVTKRLDEEIKLKIQPTHPPIQPPTHPSVHPPTTTLTAGPGSKANRRGKLSIAMLEKFNNLLGGLNENINVNQPAHPNPPINQTQSAKTPTIGCTSILVQDQPTSLSRNMDLPRKQPPPENMAQTPQPTRKSIPTTYPPPPPTHHQPQTF